MPRRKTASDNSQPRQKTASENSMPRSSKSVMSLPKLPAYAIAFKEDKARRQQMVARFQPAGLRLEFIDAIPGDSIDEATKKAFLNPARQYRIPHFLQGNAVGCAFCHYQAWQDMLDKNLPYAFIFEDDALPNISQTSHIAPHIATHIAQCLQRLAQCAASVDIVFLDARKRDLPFIKLAKLDEASHLQVAKYNDFGAHAYFITNGAARHLLTHPNRHIYEVDFHMHHWWRHHCQVLHLAPHLFTHSGRPSTIGYDRERGWAHDYFYHRLARRLYRMKDSAHKRLKFPQYIRRIKKRLAQAGLEVC